MYQSHEFYLRRAIEISKEARAAGNTPFGALLVNKDGEIIMEQGNIEITEKICTGHAEATLAAGLPMSIPESFYGTVPYIPLRSPVRCVRERFTGLISEGLFTA